MSAIIQNWYTVLADPEIIVVGLVVGILLPSRVRADIYVISYLYFRSMAAIFDFKLTHTSGSIRTSLVMLPDSENMGI